MLDPSIRRAEPALPIGPIRILIRCVVAEIITRKDWRIRPTVVRAFDLQSLFYNPQNTPPRASDWLKIYFFDHLTAYIYPLYLIINFDAC